MQLILGFPFSNAAAVGDTHVRPQDISRIRIHKQRQGTRGSREYLQVRNLDRHEVSTRVGFGFKAIHLCHPADKLRIWSNSMPRTLNLQHFVLSPH